MAERAVPSQSERRSRAIAAGVNAVQEEFDERGLGDATLIVQVIIDESGLLPDDAAIERVAREVCIVRPGEDSRDQAERYLRAAGETP